MAGSTEEHSNTNNNQTTNNQENQQDQEDQSEALAQLSAQLISAGFLRKQLPATTFDGGSVDGQKLLIKAVWSMFASRSKELTIREDLMAKQRELSYEHTRLEGFLQRAQKEKLEAQQEATASTNRANAAQKELELEKARHRSTKEDYSKLKNAERLIKTTSIHELRKKNNELDELQRRLTKLAANKDLAVASSLSWGSSGQGPLSARVDTSGGGRVGLLEFDLKASRDQNLLLQVENSRLREYLQLYEQQLVDLITEISDPAETESLDVNDSDHPSDHQTDRWINTTSSDQQLVPLAKIYKKLSLLTYKLRDKAIENSRSLKELNVKLEQSRSVAQQERIKLEEQQKKLRISFEKEIQLLKTSLKEAQSTIERWMSTELANERQTSTNAVEDVTFDQITDIPPAKQTHTEINTGVVDRKKLAQEAIALAKEKAEIEMRKFNEERQKIIKELDINTAQPSSPPSKKKIKREDHLNLHLDVEVEREGDKGKEKSLESLVVHTTKPINTSRTSKTGGKPRSSISKNLGVIHRVKLSSPLIKATTTSTNSSSSTSNSRTNNSRISRMTSRTTTKPSSSRNGVLKSLLSITGDLHQVHSSTLPSESNHQKLPLPTRSSFTSLPSANMRLNQPLSSSRISSRLSSNRLT